MPARAITTTLALLTLTTSAQANLTYEFIGRSFFFDAVGPSSGTITFAESIGAGDTASTADIIAFDFTHSFDGTNFVSFNIDNGDILTANFNGPTIADDLSTIVSGGFNVINNTDDTRLRMVANQGTINDNYLIDSPALSANGALGGAFGGWVLVEGPSLPGDFDNSGILDAADLDLLANEIINQPATPDPDFDLDNSGTLDPADLTFWITSLYGTLPGDTNLDFEVDLIDLSALASNFGSTAGWAGGNFNADTNVDLIDLSILATNFGQTPPSIPEPASLALLGLLALTRRR
ncbi:MAG: hypothetical protein RIG82_01200 [Phycisphaeraceae bacterium]